MIKKTVFFICCIVTGLLTIVYAQSPVYFKQQQKDFTIVIPEDFTEEQATAASELQHYLKIIFDSPFYVMTDNVYHGKHYISIGMTKMALDLDHRYGAGLRNDGFLLHSDHDCLFILGHEKKSELYGVYHFLENYLGCFMLTPTEVHIPRNRPDTAFTIHEVQNPDFVYRETLHRFPIISQTYSDWYKMQNRDDMTRNWGYFVHSFQHLIPTDGYFGSHPEWFSEINGQRIKDGQLCLSNPELLDTLCQHLASEMKANPEKQIWSVSQNDNVNSCTCDRCRQLDSLYGGQSGTLLFFINQVAKRFPDKTISTLAYQQTRRPPKNIRPDKNVNIMLCSIESQRQIPIADNPAEKSFRQDVEGWTALTDNIFLWDYVVQFRNYMDPFPNLHVLQSNLQFFHNHHISMMFEQGSNNNVTENYEWRTFLIAHLLWNVNIDVDSLRTRFFDAYYGSNRAPYLIQYMDTMAKALISSKQVLDIYGYPINAKNGYLSPAMIQCYQALLAKAKAIKPTEDNLDADLLKKYDDRLRFFGMPLDFAVLDMSMSNLTPELSYFTIDKDGHKTVKQTMVAKAHQFVEDCHYFKVERLEEISYSPEEFLKNIENYIAKASQTNLATGKHVTCLTQWSEKYDVGGPKALTDGNFGILNYNYNWLGFEGEHLDAIIDLDSVRDIHEIGMDFYFYPLSWIYVPEKVTYYVSNNQVHWQEVGSISYNNETMLAKAKIVKMELKDLAQRGRYVRVKAQSILTNPSWHRGYGKPCWIFTDEIIVK